jgi:glycosyltransferase involved in cell wall biosynthesis
MVTSQTLATPPEFEAEVRAEAERLSNVEFFELLPRREVLGFIRRSAAVVLTSRAEGMPNVLLESWARGVPALSLHFDPDGVIARHGLGLAAGGSWDDFVEGARRLWADSELRRTLGQQAKGYVEREHSPAAVGARWVEVLGGVLGGPAHSDRGPPGARAADRLPEDAAAD